MQPFNEGDLDIIMSLYSDEEIMRYMPIDVMDAEESQTHLNKIISDWKEQPQINLAMAVYKVMEVLF